LANVTTKSLDSNGGLGIFAAGGAGGAGGGAGSATFWAVGAGACVEGFVVAHAALRERTLISSTTLRIDPIIVGSHLYGVTAFRSDPSEGLPAAGDYRCVAEFAITVPRLAAAQ